MKLAIPILAWLAVFSATASLAAGPVAKATVPERKTSKPAPAKGGGDPFPLSSILGPPSSRFT